MWKYVKRSSFTLQPFKLRELARAREKESEIVDFNEAEVQAKELQRHLFSVILCHLRDPTVSTALHSVA